MHEIVVCDRCENPCILTRDEDADEPQETLQCGDCSKTHRVEELRVFDRAEDRGDAEILRSKRKAINNGTLDQFKQALESGVLTEIKGGGVDDTEEYAEGLGVDSDDLVKEDPRSDKDVFRDSFEELDDPSKGDIVTYCTEHGVDTEKAQKLIERGLSQGFVVQDGGSVSFSLI